MIRCREEEVVLYEMTSTKLEKGSTCIAQRIRIVVNEGHQLEVRVPNATI